MLQGGEMIVLSFREGVSIDRVMLQEDMSEVGQKVKNFELKYQNQAGEWASLYQNQGTSRPIVFTTYCRVVVCQLLG